MPTTFRRWSERPRLGRTYRCAIRDSGAGDRLRFPPGCLSAVCQRDWRLPRGFRRASGPRARRGAASSGRALLSDRRELKRPDPARRRAILCLERPECGSHCGAPGRTPEIQRRFGGCLVSAAVARHLRRSAFPLAALFVSPDKSSLEGRKRSRRHASPMLFRGRKCRPNPSFLPTMKWF